MTLTHNDDMEEVDDDIDDIDVDDEIDDIDGDDDGDDDDDDDADDDEGNIDVEVWRTRWEEIWNAASARVIHRTQRARARVKGAHEGRAPRRLPDRPRRRRRTCARGVHTGTPRPRQKDEHHQRLC